MHTYTKMAKKECKRTTQGMIHSFIHCIHGDVTLGAGDKAVNKTNTGPPSQSLKPSWGDR